MPAGSSVVALFCHGYGKSGPKKAENRTGFKKQKTYLYLGEAANPDD